MKDATTVIPRNSLIEANQSGLIAEPLIDITPQAPVPDYKGERERRWFARRTVGWERRMPSRAAGAGARLRGWGGRAGERQLARRAAAGVHCGRGPRRRSCLGGEGCAALLARPC